jgi:hypothetical protein
MSLNKRAIVFLKESSAEAPKRSPQLGLKRILAETEEDDD